VPSIQTSLQPEATVLSHTVSSVSCRLPPSRSLSVSLSPSVPSETRHCTGETICWKTIRLFSWAFQIRLFSWAHQYGFSHAPIRLFSWAPIRLFSWAFQTRERRDAYSTDFGVKQKWSRTITESMAIGRLSTLKIRLDMRFQAHSQGVYECIYPQNLLSSEIRNG